jgi:hypothetical protein
MFIGPLFIIERSGNQPNFQKPEECIEKYVIYILMDHNSAIIKGNYVVCRKMYGNGG